jgi:hypothetical protein
MTTPIPKPMTFQLVAQCLNQVRHHIPALLCLKLKVVEISKDMFVILELGSVS